MAKKIKVWVPPAWANEIRRSAAIEKAVRDQAEAIVSRAGDGFEAVRKETNVRVSYTVHPTTPRAYYSNLKHNTLLKAMQS